MEKIKRVGLVVVLMLGLFVGDFASAGEIIWGHDVPTELHVYYKHKYYSIMSNPHVDIKYHARVVDVDSGSIIECGSTVQKGTKIKYEFVPHEYTDISWFGTGSYYDSPYGNWRDTDSGTPEKGCHEKDRTWTRGGKTATGFIYGVFMPLMVTKPVKTVVGLNDISNLNCTTGTNGDVTCDTGSFMGTINAQFNFAETDGNFYMRESWGRCDCCMYNDTSNMRRGTSEDNPLYQGSGKYYKKRGYRYLKKAGGRFVLPVPAQVISCPITVINSEGQAPNAPIITNNGACTINNDFSLQVTATDPDAQDSDPEDGTNGNSSNNGKAKIKFAISYGIDTDEDGNDDAWGSGTDQFMPSSGLLASGSTVTITRKYSIAGTKKVRVRTIDGEGLSSNWVTATYTCTGSDNVDDDPEGGDNNSTLTTGGVDDDTDDTNGDPELDTGTTTSQLNISAAPVLVQSGDTSIIQWNSHNTKDCVVTGSNGDGPWGTNQGPETTSPITERTTYTLQCNDLAGNAVDAESVMVGPLSTWTEG